MIAETIFIIGCFACFLSIIFSMAYAASDGAFPLVLCISIAAVIWSSFMVGVNKTRQDAVKSGAARYEANQDGTVKFVWGSEKVEESP